MAGRLEVTIGSKLREAQVVNSFQQTASHEKFSDDCGLFRRWLAIPYRSRIEAVDHPDGVTVIKTQWYDKRTISFFPHLDWDIRSWNLRTFTPVRRIGGEFSEEEFIPSGKARGYGMIFSDKLIRIIAL